MENIFFKYGILLVGIVVILLLIAFAQNATRATIKENSDIEQTLNGHVNLVADDIEGLCAECLETPVTRDCFVVKLSTDSEICQDRLRSAKIEGTGCISPTGVFKIRNDHNECRLRILV